MLNEDDVIVKGLRRIAEMLNQITELKSDDDYFFDAMTEGIVWNDELPPPNQRGDENLSMRPILRYRASLILEEPDAEWEDYWQLAQTLFPQWIGFSRQRREPTPTRVRFLNENTARLKDEIAELTRHGKFRCHAPWE